jgi:hypothetical protein
MLRRVRFTSSVLLKNNRMLSVRSKIRSKPRGLPVHFENATFPDRSLRIGGAERDRTDDLLLAKQALSQLSYSPVRLRPGRASRGPDPASNHWWVWMDSNHRPPPYQDGALTN